MSPMNAQPWLPTPDETRELITIPHLTREMLDYCAATAVQSGIPDSLQYNSTTDEVIYHLTIQDMDRSIFELLQGTAEIWIITKGRRES